VMAALVVMLPMIASAQANRLSHGPDQVAPPEKSPLRWPVRLALFVRPGQPARFVAGEPSRFCSIISHEPDRIIPGQT
jgi:hypothetical protein